MAYFYDTGATTSNPDSLPVFEPDPNVIITGGPMTFDGTNVKFIAPMIFRYKDSSISYLLNADGTGGRMPEAKMEWEGWQQAREEEYRRIREIDESKKLTPKQKTIIWQRFLVAISQDNPYSRQDDEMRSYSHSQMNHWKSVKSPVTKPDFPSSFSKPGEKETGRYDTFIAYVTGVVYDKNTILEWYAGPDRNTSWYKAKIWVKNLTVAGGGWRMPTRKELETLYKEGAGEQNVMPLLKTTGRYVWSGETRGSSSAWGFNFYNGYDGCYDRDSFRDVRGFAVRYRK